MPLVVKDRVRETSTTTGTGTITLNGAVSNFQSFSAIGDGNTTFYTITLDSAGEWEVGIGTYSSSGTTLSRDTVLESSNGGSLVSFSAGTKNVFCTYPAEASVSDGKTNVIEVSSTDPALRITQTGTGNALVVEDNTNPDSTPFVIDAVGRIINGATQSYETVVSSSASSPSFQHHGTSSTIGAFGLYAWNAANCWMTFNKAGSGGLGNYASVNDGNAIGLIQFNGADGTNFVGAAQISAYVDGTPGTNDMPGRLVFSTTADGASAPTERMRIDSAGQVTVGKGSSSGASTGPYPLIQVAGQAATSSNVTGTPVNALALAWQEGVQDLGAGEGRALTFQASLVGDAGTYYDVARIASYKETSSDSSRASSLVFETSSNGTDAPTERLRIDSAGDINMAATSSLQKGGVDAYALKNVTYLTSGTAATYTTPTGVRALKVTVVGGGGGGGGVDGAGGSTYAVSTGGAGGGWAEALITSVEASYTYTVGAAGAGAAAGNNNGVAGGTSEFKNGAATVVISATGGAGGDGALGGSSSSAAGVLGGIGSLTGVTGVVAAGTGTNYARVLSSTFVSMGFSGGSKFGGGQTTAQPGNAARVYGEGGGPTHAGAVSTNYAGGVGFQGVIIVEEYY